MACMIMSSWIMQEMIEHKRKQLVRKLAFSTGFQVIHSLGFSFMVLHIEIYHSLIFKTWISILITWP
jgi:hypothetical protein